MAQHEEPNDPASHEQVRAPHGRIRVVAAALVDDLRTPGRLLSARRTEPPALAGGWELPGGKVEPGEDAAAALHREIREELGVQIVLGERLPGPLGGWWPLGGTHAALVWPARVRHGLPEPLADHDALRWLEPAHLWSVDWLASNRPVVSALATLWNWQAPPPAGLAD